MASIEDRQHAQRLIHEYRRRLRALEIRKARQGDSADPAIDLEIDELRLNIATLEALIEPEPAAEVQAAVKRHVEGDYTFMFAQFVKFGQRLSKVEERVDAVATAQHAAATWRVRIGEKIDANDAARVTGQRRNLLLSIGTLAVLAVLALAFLIWVL